MQYAKMTSCLKSSAVVMTAVVLCNLLVTRAGGQSSEDRWLEVLASDAPVADKCNACRELQTAGTEKSVPALAAMLTDPAVSHTARIALEVMPYPAAGAALRAAVSKTNGLTKSGIIDSLGERRDAGAVALLSDALADTDSHVRISASSALAKIGGLQAAEALGAAHAKTEADERAILGLALVRCADRIAQAGRREDARAIYGQLTQPGESRKVRLAAFRGLLQSAGSEAPRAIAQALRADDPLHRQAAAGRLRDLSEQAFSQLAANLSDLPTDVQVAVLAAIRIRGDQALAPLALKAAHSEDPGVRIAAIRALGSVGDASALTALIEASAQEGPIGKAAQESLQIICDPRVDEQIAQRLQQEKDPARRAAWIELVEARRPAGAVALLLDEATHDQSPVRSRAMAALANLAGPQDVATMAAAVLHAEKGAERDDAEKAVMLVSRQVPDPEQQAAPVVALVRQSSAKDRAALLPLLGRIGGKEALSEIQSALHSGDANSYEAGVRAICNWPDASVAGQLLELSEKAESAAHRLWALRAFIRVIALPSDIPDAEKLAMLKQAIERAERDDERNLVLQRASAVRTIEALRFLLPYLDQPSLAQTAGASITELGRHKELRDPNKAEFIPALERVLGTHQDAAVLEQARRFLQAAREG